MVKIKNPPLLTFRLLIMYNKLENVSFKKMSEIESILMTKFGKTPIINIPSCKISNEPFSFAIGPISFKHHLDQRTVQLFSDGIEFIYEQYENWQDEKKMMIECIEKIVQILEIKRIEGVYMFFIDQFVFEKEGFDLKNYFNLHLAFPEGDAIDFEDFNLGIKLNFKDSDYEIIKLLGINNRTKSTKKDFDPTKLIFQLENNYIGNKSIPIMDNIGPLETYLDDIHSFVEDKFSKILTKENKKQLGWIEENGN